MRLTKAICSLFLVLALSGCLGLGDPPPVVAQTAKPVKTYTIPQQQQIAIERNALPEDDIMLDVLDEWHNLRAEKKAGKCE